MGQINFLALTLLLLAIRNRSGLFLGLLFLVKPHFIVFLPVFLLAGEWGMTALAVCILGLSVLATGMIFGWSQYVYYLHVTVPNLLVFAGRGIYYNQGLGSFFTRVFPLSIVGELTLWFSLLIVIGGLWFIWHKRMRLVDSVMLYIPIFLLVEPLSWQHHYVFLLPVYCWLISKVSKDPVQLGLTLLSYVLVAVNFPDPPVLFLSHVFFGNSLLLSLVIHETA
jgi:alpha-1,2-mannosyltransferase